MMHPEVLCWDVTKKTNREKRDLLMATGKDGNGRQVLGLFCYISTTVAIVADCRLQRELSTPLRDEGNASKQTLHCH